MWTVKLPGASRATRLILALPSELLDPAFHRTPFPPLLVISTKRWASLAWTVLPGSTMLQRATIVRGEPTGTEAGTPTVSLSRPGPGRAPADAPGAGDTDVTTMRHTGCISAKPCRFLLITQDP